MSTAEVATTGNAQASPASNIVQRAQQADPVTWKNIEFILNENGQNVNEATIELEKIYAEPYLAPFPENERIVHTVKIFYTRLLQGFLTAAEEYEIYVLDRTAPKEFTTKAGKKMRLANLYGIGAKTEGNNPPAFVTVTLFDAEADKAASAEIGKTYRTFFTGGLKEGVLSLTATQRTSFSKPIDGPALNAGDVLEKLFPVVSIKEIDQHVSKNVNDLKLVRSTVIFANVRNSKKGTQFGSMKVYDNSVNPAEIQKGAGLSVMLDPSQVRFGAGTNLYLLGTVRAGNEQYGPSFDAKVVVANGPVIPIASPMKTSNPAATNSEGTAKSAESDDVVDFSSFS